MDETVGGEVDYQLEGRRRGVLVIRRLERLIESGIGL
jgi:hypothetical protein